MPDYRVSEHRHSSLKYLWLNNYYNQEEVNMDIFPHVNLILIMLWLVFFVIVPAWGEIKFNPFRGPRELKE